MAQTTMENVELDMTKLKKEDKEIHDLYARGK